MISTRLRVLENGALEVVDPRVEDLPLLRDIDPEFEVITDPLPGFETPRFQTMRRLGSGFSDPEIQEMDSEELWRIHDVALRGWMSGTSSAKSESEVSVLALKLELARRILRSCTLCARRCEVDRLADQRGFCGLGSKAIVAESFIHIGEEPPINPSHVISLAGCALRCRYCQQSDILFPRKVRGTYLDGQFWKHPDCEVARSLSFVGGNPDESLFGILGFLQSAPIGWALPIVWNTHAYSSIETMSLLNGIVDVYLPDLKYSSSACASSWSQVHNYPQVAQRTIVQMVDQNVPVIVRLLILPGHLRCCHFPALQFLASLPTRPRVSIRGQYSPDWQITSSDGAMAGRISREEVALANNMAQSLGLDCIVS
jgi:putative pyruvate formate lyase activating enzyme